MSQDYDFVVVGGSVAGMAVVAAIEDAAPDASLLLVDKQADLPHDRPPLSKQLLTGAQDVQSALLRSEEDWSRSSTRLRLDSEVTGLSENMTVTFANGEEVRAGAVVLTPGCVPRELDLVAGASNALTLRNLEDLRRLRGLLSPSSRVVLIGGGFIGLEVASSLINMVSSVTVIEIDTRPLQRLVGEDAARWILKPPIAAGVDIKTSCAVIEVERDDEGAIRWLSLSDGSRIPADIVIIGIGVVPATSWLDTSVVDISDGIVANELLQTKTSGIFAAGDAMRFHDIRIGKPMRVEHWTTAREQGRCAGRNAVSWLLQQPLDPFLHVPYVWSDQFGVKIQIAGYAGHASDVRTRISTQSELYVEYFEGSTLCAVLAVNMPREVMAARRELANQARTFSPTE